MYLFDLSSILEQCVHAWLRFQISKRQCGRTIRCTNCGFNLTSNIKNLRLGVKMNASMQHALQCQSISNASCHWPAPNHDARSHWQVGQALRCQRWWRSHVLRNSQHWHGMRVEWPQASDVTAVYTGSGWSIRIIRTNWYFKPDKFPSPTLYHSIAKAYKIVLIYADWFPYVEPYFKILRVKP